MPIIVKGTRRPEVFFATGEAEAFDGGANYDKVTYERSAAGITINLVDLTQNTGDAEGDSYVAIESLVLTEHGDRFVGAQAKDFINGKSGNDWLEGKANDDTLLGDYGRDTLDGGEGNDGIWGGSLEDLILGGAGNDKLFGDSYNDTVDGGAGNDLMNGGTGFDTASYASATAGVTVGLASTLAQVTGGAGIDTLALFESLTGSGFDDRLTGNAGANVVLGGAGNDTLAGGGGTDTLDGGDGIDSISFATSATAVNVTIAESGSQVIGGIQLVSIEGVEGSSRSDTITGSSADNIFAGGADSGTVLMVATTQRFYQYAADLLIPIAQIDDIGEWVVVPKRYPGVEDAGHLVSIQRADGDAIFAVTNGFNDARDWNATLSGMPLFVINLGPGGEIGADSTVIFNAGPGNATALFQQASTEGGFPMPKAAGSNANGAVNVTTYALGTVTAGDVLAGGAGADTFRYSAGGGVDRITDFSKGVDHIDLDATWFDGNTANGEVVATASGGGTLIQFSDASADGVIDNSAILISSLAIGSYDGSIFV